MGNSLVTQQNYPVVKVEQFLKKFKKIDIGPFNFTITLGKMHAIVGGSGSGKTVLIKSLIGGNVRYKGNLIIANEKAGSTKAKKLIGYVPEFITFPENISAYKFLVHMGKISGISGQKLKSRIRILMQSFELWEQRNIDVNSFSSGMKKRIMIIQGILHDPDILFLDEPEAGLDVRNRQKIISYLADLVRYGKTVIFSTHLIDEAKYYLDEITFVNLGRQVFSGSVNKMKLRKCNYMIVSNPDMMSNFLNTNNVENWYDPVTNELFFILNNPNNLFYISKFAVEKEIKIKRIGNAELNFELLGKFLYNKHENSEADNNKNNDVSK